MLIWKAVLLTSLTVTVNVTAQDSPDAGSILSLSSSLGQQECLVGEIRIDNTLIDLLPGSCFAQRTLSTNSTELLENDVRVCECLQNNPIHSLRESNDSAVFTEEKNNHNRRTGRSYINNLAFQILTQTTDVNEIGARLATQTGQELRENLRRVGSWNAPSTPIISEFLSEVNAIPAQNAGTQCVTYLEYSSQRTLPYDNNFFTSLSGVSIYNPDDWNISKLSLRYDSLSESEKPGIAARMTFLARNPTISSVFNADEAVTPTIRRQQRELFEIVKNLAPSGDSQCRSRVNGCWEEIHKSGSYDQFRSNISTFMSRSDITDLISEETTRDYASQFEQSLSPVTNTHRVSTSDAYFRSLQIRNPRVLNGCSGSNVDDECYDNFNLHCRLLNSVREVASQNTPQSGRALLADLRNSEIIHGSSEQEQNNEFEAFNNMMCQQQHSNASGRRMNFFEFRAQHCAGPGNSSPECREGNRRQLLDRFLSDFPISQDEGSSRIRSGLSGSIGTIELASINIAQIRTANNIAEAPKSLRERFNGSIPTISAQGVLVAFVPRKMPTSTTNSNSSISSISSSSPSSSTGLASTSSVNPGSQAFQKNTNNLDSSRSGNYLDSRSPLTSDSGLNSDSLSQREPRKRRSKRRSDPFADLRESPINNQAGPRQGSVQDTATAAPSFQAAPVTGGETRLQPRSNGGGGSTAASVGGAISGSSGGRRASIVEVTPRRSSGSRSPASVNDTPVPADNFDFRPVIPVELNESTLQNALANPQVLADDPAVMEKVNASSNQVVRLGLRTAGSTEDTVVYAIKENGSVRFSLVAPSENNQDRSAVLGTNEMNVRVMDQTEYTRIRSNPDHLRTYIELLSVAQTLPGDVVQLNIIPRSGVRMTVIFDKRTSEFRINP